MNAEKGMTYAKFFPSDWRTGCLVLNLEEEGLYIRVVAYMYDTGKPVPSDDRQAARLLNVQIQKYMKVIESLIEKGKLFRGQGWIINERVMEELDKWKIERLARSEAAKRREAERRLQAERQGQPPQQPPTQPPQQPMGGSLGGHIPQPHGVPPEVSEEKDNENNGRLTTTLPELRQTSTTKPEAIVQNPESKELASLNGAAHPMVNDIVGWMANGDREAARTWLVNSMHIYGSEIVADSYAKLKADLMTGKLIARPLQAWAAIAARMRKEPKGQEPTESRSDRIARFVKEAEEKNRRVPT